MNPGVVFTAVIAGSCAAFAVYMVFEGIITRRRTVKQLREKALKQTDEEKDYKAHGAEANDINEVIF